MKDHIEAEQLHKAGLRYFFPAGDNSDIAQRVEWGVPFKPAGALVPARPRPVRERARRARPRGRVDLLGGCRVERSSSARRAHGHVSHGDERARGDDVAARWVVDAAGPGVHPQAQARPRGGQRPPLSTRPGSASPGASTSRSGSVRRRVVRADDRARPPQAQHQPPDGSGLLGLADPALVRRDLDRDRGRGALPPDGGDGHSTGRSTGCAGTSPSWGRSSTPGATRSRTSCKVKDFSYGCEQVFSGDDRWCLTGEAGAFLDPFYSPGSDFIAIGNTFIDRRGDPRPRRRGRAERAKQHNDLY